MHIDCVPAVYSLVIYYNNTFNRHTQHIAIPKHYLNPIDQKRYKCNLQMADNRNFFLVIYYSRFVIKQKYYVYTVGKP